MEEGREEGRDGGREGSCKECSKHRGSIRLRARSSFSFKSKYNNHRLDTSMKISLANHIIFVNSSSMNGRFLEERLNGYWSPVIIWWLVCFQRLMSKILDKK